MAGQDTIENPCLMDGGCRKLHQVMPMRMTLSSCGLSQPPSSSLPSHNLLSSSSSSAIGRVGTQTLLLFSRTATSRYSLRLLRPLFFWGYSDSVHEPGRACSSL